MLDLRKVFEGIFFDLSKENCGFLGKKDNFWLKNF